MRKLILLMAALVNILPACELADNLDPKAPLIVPVETIFSNALRDGLAHIDNMDQNVNIARMLCQYNTLLQYTDPSRYHFNDRQIPDGYWNTTYLVLRDLNEVKFLLADEIDDGSPGFTAKHQNKMAITDILEVLMYQNLVDLFGNIPYGEALQGDENPTPKYEDAQRIYADLQSRLTYDIRTLYTGIDAGSWGKADLVYGGDAGRWLRFASTLKLRMGMRLADVDPVNAQNFVNEALAAGCLETDESMQLHWIGVPPHVNTIYQVFILANRHDYVPTKTIIDIMAGLDDARMPAYFTRIDTSTRPGIESWIYHGLEYGLVGGSSYQAFSHFSNEMFTPDFPATISCHAEVEFLLAEAAARGLQVDGLSARDHYEAGIEESHRFWGVSMDPDYLSHPDVAWNDARAKELIGIQKWIALYNRGNEGYAVFRCFDWPVLVPPQEMSYTDIPMRLPYPYNEPDLNAENYDAAAAAIGGDSVSTLLFWDATRSTESPSPGF